MNMEELLRELIKEIKALRFELANKDVEICTPNQAIAILGFNNKRYLSYFHQKNLLNRRKGGKGFLYFKSECIALANKIKEGVIVVPSIKEIYGKE